MPLQPSWTDHCTSAVQPTTVQLNRALQPSCTDHCSPAEQITAAQLYRPLQPSWQNTAAQLNRSLQSSCTDHCSPADRTLQPSWTDHCSPADRTLQPSWTDHCSPADSSHQQYLQLHVKSNLAGCKLQLKYKFDIINTLRAFFPEQDCRINRIGDFFSFNINLNFLLQLFYNSK